MRRHLHVLLIALGLLLAQGPMLLHLLLVPHATCEHGELVEGAAGVGRAGAHDSAPGAGEGRSDHQQIAAAHPDGSGHEHCDALAVRHRVPDVGPAIAPASLLSIEPIAASGERAERRPVALLSLAPKSSPPAA